MQQISLKVLSYLFDTKGSFQTQCEHRSPKPNAVYILSFLTIVWDFNYFFPSFYFAYSIIHSFDQPFNKSILSCFR